MRLWLQYHLYHPTLNSLIKVIDFLQCTSSAVQTSSSEVATFKPIKESQEPSLQGKKESLGRARVFETPWTVAHQAPLSVEFFQARILQQVTISFSKGSSQPRDGTRVSCTEADSLLTELPGKPITTGKRGIIIFIFSSFKLFSKQEVYQYIN